MEKFTLKDPLRQDNRARGISGYINKEGCYICDTLKKHKDGYIHISRLIDGLKNVLLLHRYVFETYSETKIPNGMVIRHKCDNSNCINPNHLILGTHQDNVDDRVKRERSAIGVNNGRSKLDEHKVREIINSNLSIAQLSNIYKVDMKAIRSVKNFDSWKHVV